jgi:hypothetical protein
MAAGSKNQVGQLSAYAEKFRAKRESTLRDDRVGASFIPCPPPDHYFSGGFGRRFLVSAPISPWPWRASFNHLVGAGEERGRDLRADCANPWRTSVSRNAVLACS